jgi:hypothetical protein
MYIFCPVIARNRLARCTRSRPTGPTIFPPSPEEDDGNVYFDDCLHEDFSFN